MPSESGMGTGSQNYPDPYRPAQLAAMAARVSANGTSSIAFRVRHSAGRGPIWAPTSVSIDDPLPFDADDNLVITESTDVAPEEALNSLLGREEFLYFSCGGVEFQVDTRGEDLRRLPRRSVP